MIDRQWGEAQNILVVRLDNLGDVLLATPAIRAIRCSLPRAHITLLASPVGAQVAELNTDIDEVIVYAAPWVDPWRLLPQDPDRELQLIERLRAERFDAAVIFTSFRQSPLPAALLCYIAGIPLRLGATSDAAGSLLTTRHKHPDRLMHEVERGLDLVGAVGITAIESRLVLNVPAGERDAAHARWGFGPRVVMHPGCSMPARTYPWELYAETIDLLVRDQNASVAITGASQEIELVGRIAGRLSPEARRRVQLFAGVLSFAELAALVASADVMLTNNTGPMHVAAAVGTPVVALFALTNPPEQWRPWGVEHRLLYHDVPCQLCYSRICPFEQECLRGVTPEDVLNATTDLLASSATGIQLVHERAIR